MNINDSPRIRQVIFHLDKIRNYKFDVNSTITIKGLKRMISAAANLTKSGMRLIHRLIDYSDDEDISLNEIDEKSPIIEFELSIIEPSFREIEQSRIKLRVGDNCKNHPAKFTYFFCYDCMNSICSTCIRDEVHRTHNIIEKCDYLQDSHHLVNLLFKDLGSFISDSKIDKKSELEELRNKIKNVHFPNLRELLNQIEKRQLEILDKFLVTSEVSFANIRKNVVQLKDNCAEGLEKLKEEINIENMVVDEEVFLIFDQKYREMANEKERVKEDQKKFDNLQDSFAVINNTLTKIHLDMFNYLDTEKKGKHYENLDRTIESNQVISVNREEIIDKLLSDVKPRFSGGRRSVLENSRRMSKSPIPNRNTITGAINSIFNYDKSPQLDTISQAQNFAIKFHSDLFDHQDNIVETETILRELNEIKGTNTYIESKSNKKEEAANILPQPDKVMMRCHTGTNEVIIYDDLTGTMTTKSVLIPFSDTKEFLKYSAWVNHNGKLYITGGLNSDNTSSQAFYEYDISTGNIKILKEMLSGRHCHSMLYDNNQIYVVGGHKNLTVEKYDIEDMKWTKLSNLKAERQNSILYIYNGHLYAFFGYTIGCYIDSVEKLKLSLNKAKWEFAPYKNPDKLVLKLIGCGTVPHSEDAIYFFGGKNSGEARKSAFIFNFTTSTFTKCDVTLDGPAFFTESKLHDFGNFVYGGFDDENNDHFLKLQMT